MKRVLTAVILIPLVVLALFKAPLWLFTLLVLGVALLAAREYFGIVKAQGYRPMAGLSYFLLALSIAWFSTAGVVLNSQPTERLPMGLSILRWFSLQWILAPVIFAPLLLLLFLLFTARYEPLSQALPDAAVSYLLLPYIGLTLGAITFLRSSSNGALYLLFLMLLVWCGDVAAYYVGRAMGKHKLAPRVSPGKTWEGAFASLIGAVVVGLLLFRFIDPIANGLQRVHLLGAPAHMLQIPDRPRTFPFAPLWFVALFAICINVAAQFGDLVESMLKRGAGVKDSGTLLPGHGGVLDRIDALLFALPVGLVFYFGGMVVYFAR